MIQNNRFVCFAIMVFFLFWCGCGSTGKEVAETSENTDTTITSLEEGRNVFLPDGQLCFKSSNKEITEFINIQTRYPDSTFGIGFGKREGSPDWHFSFEGLHKTEEIVEITVHYQIGDKKKTVKEVWSINDKAYTLTPIEWESERPGASKYDGIGDCIRDMPEMKDIILPVQSTATNEVITQNTAMIKDSINYYIAKKCLFHASPAARIEGDIYRFYPGDTVKVEYYDETNGYMMLIGTMKWKNDSTIGVKWTQGWKDLNFEDGGVLKTPIEEDLKIALFGRDYTMPKVKINGRAFWVQCD